HASSPRPRGPCPHLGRERARLARGLASSGSQAFGSARENRSCRCFWRARHAPAGAGKATTNGHVLPMCDELRSVGASPFPPFLAAPPTKDGQAAANQADQHVDPFVFSAVLAAAACHAGWNALLKLNVAPVVATVLVAVPAGLLVLPLLPLTPLPAAAA